MTKRLRTIVMLAATVAILLIATAHASASGGACDDCPAEEGCSVIGCHVWIDSSGESELKYCDYQCNWNGGSGWRYDVEDGTAECMVNCDAILPPPGEIAD